MAAMIAHAGVLILCLAAVAAIPGFRIAKQARIATQSCGFAAYRLAQCVKTASTVLLLH